ncbi:MAG: GNAT family N-acetyltransferase [Pseudohongiellaceae bacterium]
MEDYLLVEEVVSVADFIRLRRVSGLSARPEQAVARGLSNSLYGVQIKIGAETIAMGRIIGDGGLNFDIVDVAVAPEHQGKGLGRMLMEALLGYIKANVEPHAYVTLMADVPSLYEKFGFHYTSPDSEGMYYKW